MTTFTYEAGAGTTDGASEAASTKSSIATVADAIKRNIPRDLDGAGVAVGNAVRAASESVKGAQDDSVFLGASLAAGMAIGLLMSGGSRLLAAGTVATSVVLGATLLGRRSGPPRARWAAPAS